MRVCVYIIPAKVTAITGGQSAKCKSWAEVLCKTNSCKSFLDGTWVAQVCWRNEERGTQPLKCW